MTDPIEIDALGLLCPLPVLRLRKRIEGMADGTVVDLLADDPVAVIDVPHFCSEAGHQFESATDIADQVQSDRVPHRYRIIVGTRP